MTWKVYLSGEIHTPWREELENAVKALGLPVTFYAPVTDHAASDDCGAKILGAEMNPFWHDRKGAGLNSIRTQTLLAQADIVVVKFGDKYRQWNAAFEAGIASCLGKPLIVIHPDEFQHALKEVDSAAHAVTDDCSKVPRLLRYIIEGTLE
ncbi:YtoQ family protein [Verrucomicrobiaceae bacterium N1E253]|uniref:YtoQ family protein n=1 Tax=Oceaniferula marina TaxID=2748318 RepID=A0A851GHP7_9BACT|nr:YtoQ family protein [Oceaniferula marina]NWK54140.1 YtoQ family protein [Oceaniferula marina]